MKLADLERHPRLHDCILVREGGSHSIWRHQGTPWQTSVPRHREIRENAAKKILANLGFHRFDACHGQPKRQKPFNLNHPA